MNTKNRNSFVVRSNGLYLCEKGRKTEYRANENEAILFTAETFARIEAEKHSLSYKIETVSM